MSECKTCKHGKPLTIEEFEAMGDWKVSCPADEWECYECDLHTVVKQNGVCKMWEEKK